ncbi:hypothetical protein PBY51_016867 [Eleginops maclovinus]|uniref:Uncharacterized protein n=1 Tax=Eleginops maclovinus TaxID=56733 RepID=A0AAN8AA74_ELEMC|nr:hypothetical protein PBY51_016867 [Eleginops maclovinus]
MAQNGMVRAISPSAIVRWNKYMSDGVLACLLVPITHPTNRFPGMASKKMAMRMRHSMIAGVAVSGSVSHDKVFGFTT